MKQEWNIASKVREREKHIRTCRMHFVLCAENPSKDEKSLRLKLQHATPLWKRKMIISSRFVDCPALCSEKHWNRAFNNNAVESLTLRKKELFKIESKVFGRLYFRTITFSWRKFRNPSMFRVLRMKRQHWCLFIFPSRNFLREEEEMKKVAQSRSKAQSW